MTNNTKPKPNAETLSLKLLIEELSPSDDYYIIRQLRSIIIRYLEKERGYNLLRGLILSFFYVSFFCDCLAMILSFRLLTYRIKTSFEISSRST